MVYAVERIYLTNERGAPLTTRENAVRIEAENAHEAALVFINRDGGKLLGSITDFPGDRAHASVWRDGRLYVLTVELAGD